MVLGLYPKIARCSEPPSWVQRLRSAKCAAPTETVAEMYEDLPYPSRDPAAEAPGEPFAIDVPSTPAAIAHHIYGGALDFSALGRPFRILVAGGGTGDATVMAAVTFDAAQVPVDVVHCDLSAASIEVARQRVSAHNLTAGVRVTFLQRSFLELRAEEVHGTFDFINAVGVVHHLASPAEGLRALHRLLKPDGGMFVMVYGELGRTGVYDMQDAWRLSGMSRREFLKGPLQVLMQHLPETNRLARNRRMWSQKVQRGDLTTLSDLLVHSCDHAYTVASLLELLAAADLALLSFNDPGKYALPEELQAPLASVLSQMPDELQRFHFAELIRADVFAHLFWAVPAPAAAVGAGGAAAAAASPDAVPCPVWSLIG